MPGHKWSTEHPASCQRGKAFTHYDRADGKLQQHLHLLLFSAGTALHALEQHCASDRSTSSSSGPTWVITPADSWPITMGLFTTKSPMRPYFR